MSHYDDEAQAEQVKIWWKENWKALAAGLVLGLSAIVGWEQFKAHKEARATEAARMFEDLKAALVTDKSDEVTAIGDKLKSEFGSTPYASLAMLRIAQHAVEKGRFDEALPPLAWVGEHSADAQLKPLARLREARVLAQQGKFDLALARLDAEVEAAYAPMVAELRGDIKLAQGDRKAARAAFEQALLASEANAANRETLQRKIDDLADAA